jgi:hypothetical protein
MAALSKHDYPALFEEYDQRLAAGESPKEVRTTFESRGINWGTFQNRRTQAKKVHRSTLQEHQDTPEAHLGTPDEPELRTVLSGTPEHSGLSEEQYTQEHRSIPIEPDIPSVPLSTPDRTETSEHLGTLEGHQEVMEDVLQSVPDARHIGIEGAYQGVPEHPSTPEVHPEVSLSDSTTAHSGVPARQDHLISTPTVHPGTPTEEDWELWGAVKSQWPSIEKMLSDWQTRHSLFSTPIGTPRHTLKKTYVVDSLYVELIDRYAREQGVELKDVVNLAFHEFFERRELLPQERKPL